MYKKAFARKLKDNKYLIHLWEDEGYKYFYPLFEMHQGILVPYTREPQEPRDEDDNGEPGRQPGKPGPPEKDSKQTKKENTPRQPRPSKA